MSMTQMARAHGYKISLLDWFLKTLMPLQMGFSILSCYFHVQKQAVGHSGSVCCQVSSCRCQHTIHGRPTLVPSIARLTYRFGSAAAECAGG